MFPSVHSHVLGALAPPLTPSMTLPSRYPFSALYLTKIRLSYYFFRPFRSSTGCINVVIIVVRRDVADMQYRTVICGVKVGQTRR